VELIGYDTSSLTALFLASRAPDGQIALAPAVGELIKRYGFAGFPTNVQQLEAAKVEFRQGAFKDVGIESFSIYGDGVVVTSKSSTDVLDDFLQDVTEWMGSALGLKRVETHLINTAYESGLLVRSEAPLLKALEALAPIQDLLTKSVKSAMGLDARIEPFGIAFSADHSLIPGMKPGPFRLERRAGLGFDTNLYVSQAPLRSADHIKVLQRLEKLVE
jgi:hypothetical protein